MSLSRYFLAVQCTCPLSPLHPPTFKPMSSFSNASRFHCNVFFNIICSSTGIEKSLFISLSSILLFCYFWLKLSVCMCVRAPVHAFFHCALMRMHEESASNVYVYLYTIYSNTVALWNVQHSLATHNDNEHKKIVHPYRISHHVQLREAIFTSKCKKRQIYLLPVFLRMINTFSL